MLLDLEQVGILNSDYIVKETDCILVSELKI